MKHTWRTLAGAAVAAALVAAPLIAAPAMAEEVEHKVVVCKYVTTPGEGEVLQTGGNPIEVDEHALGEGFTGTFPYPFVDAQGSSIAIGWVGEGLDITDCPGYQPPQPDDEALSETRDRSFCTEPLDGTRTAVVEGRTGARTYVWDGDSWEPHDTWGEWMVTSSTVSADAACEPGVVPVPTLFNAAPEPPTCEDDGALPALGTFANVTLSWDRAFDGPGTYTLTATAATGFMFPDGSTVMTKDFTVLGAIGYQSEDPEAACYSDEEPPPIELPLAIPSIHDACGTANDTAELPASEQGVTYAWLDEEDDSELDVVAVFGEGFVPESVPAGWVEVEDGVYVYAQADFTDVACPVVTPTTTPGTTTTPPTGLAVTGGAPAPVLPILGALTLLVGIAATVFGAIRRRA